MENFDIKTIDIKDIHTFSFSVSEEINDKYLLKFLRTSILDKDIPLNKNTTFYYRFLKESLTYEIVLFDTKVDSLIFEPLVFEEFYKDENIERNSIDLFLTKEYFCLYKEREFVFLKVIKDVSDDEIKEYISKTYNLNVSNIYNFDESKIEELKKEYVKNKKVKPQASFVFEDKSFTYFKLFTLLGAFLLLGGLYFKDPLVLNEETSSKDLEYYKSGYEKLLDKHARDYDIDETRELLKYLKIYKVRLINLEYKNKKTAVLISHKNKQNLFDFISVFEKRIKINKIEFRDEEKQFFMDLVIKN